MAYKVLMEKFRQAEQIIQAAQKILLITHLRPDGDAVGSTCALAEYLAMAGKSWVIFCRDLPADKFGFLACAKAFNNRYGATDKRTGLVVDVNNFDLIIVLDCGSLSRTGLENEILQRDKNVTAIEFDHHLRSLPYADLEIKNERASSTSELVFGFLKANNIKISARIAEAILTGILTDTENFLYPSAGGAAMRISAEMMLAGACLPKIVNRAYRDKAIDSLKIWGVAMSKLKINKKYNIAVTAIPHDELKERAVDREVLDGISNFLGNLKGVKAVIFLREVQEGVVNGSIRTSHPEVDVDKLAQLFGGGGHKKSSGFSISGRLVETDSGWKIV